MTPCSDTVRKIHYRFTWRRDPEQVQAVSKRDVGAIGSATRETGSDHWPSGKRTRPSASANRDGEGLLQPAPSHGILRGGEPMANCIRPIVVNEADRRELERLQRSPSTRAGLSRRARAVLLMAQDVPGVETAERTGHTVSRPAAPVRGAGRGRSAGPAAFGPAADNHGAETGSECRPDRLRLHRPGPGPELVAQPPAAWRRRPCRRTRCRGRERARAWRVSCWPSSRASCEPTRVAPLYSSPPRLSAEEALSRAQSVTGAGADGLGAASP